jgi:hypothetical protein
LDKVQIFEREPRGARLSLKNLYFTRARNAIVHLWGIKGKQVVRFAACIDTPTMLSALAGS